MAIPRPAAMTAKGPIHPPPAPSAASASAGQPPTAMTPRISERRTNASSTYDVLVVFRLVAFDGSRDVQHRQHDEDERLEQGYQDLQRIDEDDVEQQDGQAAEAAQHRSEYAARQRPADEAVEPHQEEEDGQQDVATQHVAEEPQGQRERARQVTDHLDHEHRPLEPPRDRSHEVLEVRDGAVRANADVVVRDEDDE